MHKLIFHSNFSALLTAQAHTYTDRIAWRRHGNILPPVLLQTFALLKSAAAAAPPPPSTTAAA